MPYVPGDNWVICDISGRKLRMSQSVKTWDGLRVHPDYWYPKHPQLSVRGVRDNMSVRDARPRPVNIYTTCYGFGAFTLTSSEGTDFIVYIDNNGNLQTVEGTLGPARTYIVIDRFALIVDDVGVVTPHGSESETGPLYLLMQDCDGNWYHLTVSYTPIVYGIGRLYGTGRTYGYDGSPIRYTDDYLYGTDYNYGTNPILWLTITPVN